MKSVFNSKYWPELDRGTLNEEEAVKLFCSCEPDLSEEIISVMEKWKDMLLPMEESIELLKKLKSNGYSIYVLSNYHRQAFHKIKEENDFFNIIDGGVISFEINYIKPQREIYQFLLEKYKIKAEETLFIDDMEINIKAAEDVGIRAVLFTDIDEVKEKLYKMDINI
ncbi:HAD family hydrolase [Clostridium polynesiense]|uniref:HAD family hydrolase n=1 Tax=Clostridium polynesiense TaxID=1325933 RepID=UPI0006938B84|nr:HAD family phosphatase [Clostridium polynesiense]